MFSVLSITYVPSAPLHGEIGTDDAIHISFFGGVQENTEFTFSGIIMAFALLALAITGSALVGISFLGSSLGTETTQALIFNSILYLGVWAVFSILAYPLLGQMWVFGGLIWLIITIIYIVGFANEIQGTASA